MFSRDEMQRAIEDALKSMEGVALELYRRGREPLLEELEEARRLVDQLGAARDKAEAELRELQRSTSEALTQAVEWQRERDEARARVETVTASRDKAEDTIISLIDRVAWYRNLAISLGARPSQMLSANDRWLCEKEGAPRDYISAQSVELEDLWARNDRLVEDCRELRDRIKLVRGSFMGDVNERWLEMLNRAESERAEAVDMRMRLLTNPFLRKDADQRTREQEIEYLKYERDSARTVANNAVAEINALTAARCECEQAISAAYRRGAEAMREACEAAIHAAPEGAFAELVIRALPIPEEP